MGEFSGWELELVHNTKHFLTILTTKKLTDSNKTNTTHFLLYLFPNSVTHNAEQKTNHSTVFFNQLPEQNLGHQQKALGKAPTTSGYPHRICRGHLQAGIYWHWKPCSHHEHTGPWSCDHKHCYGHSPLVQELPEYVVYSMCSFLEKKRKKQLKSMLQASLLIKH